MCSKKEVVSCGYRPGIIVDPRYDDRTACDSTTYTLDRQSFLRLLSNLLGINVSQWDDLPPTT
jgi:hypothetical protein